MLETFFLTVNEWIVGASVLAALGCFLWGMVSVLLSPCHLASIPLIVAYVGGQQQISQPREAVYYSGTFSIGLFISIAMVGIICALLGRMLVRQAQLGASYRVTCLCFWTGSPHRAKLNQQPVPSVARLAESDTWRTTVVKRTQGTLQAAGETYLP